MRKYLYLAMAAATATVLAAPLVAQAAPAGHADPRVLTLGKVGGPPAKVGDTLAASLKKGTNAVFNLKGIVITCKSSSFTANVVKNPKAPGAAVLSQTSESISKCTVSIPGATVKSVKALNTPYNVQVIDSKGFPVVVSGRSKAKPIELTSTALVSGKPIVCTYKATTVVGKASNVGNTISVVKTPFSVVKGSNLLCPATSTLTATYGPVVDITAKGSPNVFVN